MATEEVVAASEADVAVTEALGGTETEAGLTLEAEVVASMTDVGGATDSHEAEAAEVGTEVGATTEVAVEADTEVSNTQPSYHLS